MRVAELPSAHAVKHDNFGAHASEGSDDFIKVAGERPFCDNGLDEEATPRGHGWSPIDAVGGDDNSHARRTSLDFGDGL